MTTPQATRRAISCAQCGFPNDDPWHMRSCVPTRFWPKELRDRKLSSMGHDRESLDQLPEKRKMSLHEYRQLHPEANPITSEKRIIQETRTEKDGRVRTWTRVEGFREAVNRSQPCPRCHRPLLNPQMHIVCRPVEGGPVRVVETVQQDAPPIPVRSGAGWYEQLAEAPDPEPESDEMLDFARDPQEAVEERVRAEQEAVRETITTQKTVYLCDVCQKPCASKAGRSAHMRSHRDVTA